MATASKLKWSGSNNQIPVIPLDKQGATSYGASGLIGFAKFTYPTDATLAGFEIQKIWKLNGIDITSLIASNAVYLSSQFGPDGKTPTPGWKSTDFSTYASAYNASTASGKPAQILVRDGSYITQAMMGSSIPGALIGTSWAAPAIFSRIGAGGWNDRSAKKPVVVAQVAIGYKYNYDFLITGGFDFFGTVTGGSASSYGLSISDNGSVQSGSVIIQECVAEEGQQLISVANTGSNPAYQPASIICIGNKAHNIFGNNFGVYTAGVWDFLAICNDLYEIGWDYANDPRDDSGERQGFYSNATPVQNDATTQPAIKNPQHRYIGNTVVSTESIGLKVPGGVICGNVFTAAPIAIMAYVWDVAVGYNYVEGDEIEFDILTSAATNGTGLQQGSPGLALSDGIVGIPSSTSLNKTGNERGVFLWLDAVQNAYVWGNRCVNKPGPTVNNFPCLYVKVSGTGGANGNLYPATNCNLFADDNVFTNWFYSSGNSLTAIPNTYQLDAGTSGMTANVTWGGTNYIDGVNQPGIVGGATWTTPGFGVKSYAAANDFASGPTMFLSMASQGSTLQGFDLVIAGVNAYTPAA